MWPRIKFMKALIVVLDTYKNDEDPSKNESASECAHKIIPIISIWRLFRHSRAANSKDPCSILLNFKPIQAFIAVLVTCKINKIQSKMKVLKCLQH